MVITCGILFKKYLPTLCCKDILLFFPRSVKVLVADSVQKAYFSIVQNCVTNKVQKYRSMVDCCLVAKPYPILLQPHGLQPARHLCPQDLPSKNTGVGCHFLLQGIFLTQELNSHLLHCQMDSLADAETQSSHVLSLFPTLCLALLSDNLNCDQQPTRNCYEFTAALAVKDQPPFRGFYATPFVVLLWQIFCQH